MADVDIAYDCGCGFKTKRLEAAVEHSDNRNHTIPVLGTIRPASKTNNRKPQAGTKPRTVTEPRMGVDTSRIEELRQKIGKGD